MASGAGLGATTFPPPGPGMAPSGTQPIAAGPVRADDFADILPPVTYPPGQRDGRRGGYPGPDDGFGRPGSPERAGQDARAAAPGEDRDADRWARPRRQPILVLATMVLAVSLAVLLPVAGTLIALAVLALLRAGDLAHRGSDQRGAFMSAATYPFFVVRSLISTVVLAPLALIVAAGAAGLTFLAMPASPGLHALSYGAGALVAFYAYGPGSGKARRQLNRVWGAVVRGPGLQAVALFGMCALAVAADGRRGDLTGRLLAAGGAQRHARARAHPPGAARAPASRGTAYQVLSLSARAPTASAAPVPRHRGEPAGCG